MKTPFRIQLIVGEPDGKVDVLEIDAKALDMQNPEDRAMALGQLEVAMAEKVGQQPNVQPT